jgi:hypothetical protein
LASTEDHEKSIHERMQVERRSQCLSLCLQRMPVSDSKLFLTYHNVRGEHLQYRQGMAKQMGITLGALRVRVNRIRDGLEKCVRKCVASRQITPRMTK